MENRIEVEQTSTRLTMSSGRARLATDDDVVVLSAARWTALARRATSRASAERTSATTVAATQIKEENVCALLTRNGEPSGCYRERLHAWLPSCVWTACHRRCVLFAQQHAQLAK